MNWFASLTLRFFVGAVFGFAVTVAISYFGLPRAHAADSPFVVWFLLVGPLALMLVLAFLVPDWLQRGRWKNRWLPLAEGRLPVPGDRREKTLHNAIRALSSPWVLPNTARRRLEDFLITWVKTLVRDRVHDPVVWEMMALVWFELKENSEFLEQLRALLMELDTLDDAAFDVGLSLLSERDTDVALAILLAKEGLQHDLSGIAVERHALLENAWLAAYAKDEELRPYLLPVLLRRFLDVSRRDEVSGRIYLDAFIAGERAPKLREEMKRTAEVLGRTGRSPEMTANLRALSDASDGKVWELEPGEVEGTILRAPKKWQDRPLEAKQAPKRETKPSAPVIDTEAASSGTTFETKDQLRDLPEPTPRVRRRPALGRWVLSIVLLTALAGGVYLGWMLYVDQGQGKAEEPALVPASPKMTPPGEVLSPLPFTVQIAALPTRGAAVRKIRELRSEGVDAYYVITERNDTRWYRIRFGKYENTRAAQAAADSLKQLGVIQEYFIATFEKGEVPQDLPN